MINNPRNRMAKRGRPSKEEAGTRPPPEPIVAEWVPVIVNMRCPSCGRQISPKVLYTWTGPDGSKRRMRCCQSCGSRFELMRDELGNETARVVR